MNFLFPWYLLSAVAIAIPLLLYFFYRKQGRQGQIPSSIFLREYGKNFQIFQSSLWLLLLEILFILFLAIAIGVPGAQSNNSLCIIDDNPYTDGIRQRKDFQEAVKQCRRKPVRLSYLAADIWESSPDLPALAHNRSTHDILLSSLRGVTSSKLFLTVPGGIPREWQRGMLPGFRAITIEGSEPVLIRRAALVPNPLDRNVFFLEYSLSQPHAATLLRREGETVLPRGITVSIPFSVSGIEPVVFRAGTDSVHFKVVPGQKRLVRLLTDAPRSVASLLAAAGVDSRIGVAEVGIPVGYGPCSGRIGFLRGTEPEVLQMGEKNIAIPVKAAFCDGKPLFHFRSGNPAVTWHENLPCFCFDPDSAPEYYRLHPVFALWMYGMLSAGAAPEPHKQLHGPPGFYFSGSRSVQMPSGNDFEVLNYGEAQRNPAGLLRSQENSLASSFPWLAVFLLGAALMFALRR